MRYCHWYACSYGNQVAIGIYMVPQQHLHQGKINKPQKTHVNTLIYASQFCNSFVQLIGFDDNLVTIFYQHGRQNSFNGIL